MLIASYTTEIVVTSRRFVKKTGLIVRRAEELSLDRIEEVNLRQSVLGRLLNYGDLTVRGTGEGVIDLVMVDDPIRLRRELQSADTR
ncbi:MAG: PH domain-containing protein [Alphaproteobacteria bacterium]|nr:PH domain-containing protein [Alphaproteobacteria bacterium]